jgi:hypothetical protein
MDNEELCSRLNINKKDGYNSTIKDLEENLKLLTAIIKTAKNNN